MRFMVTGGLGFIGSHFVRLVLRERPDALVVNFDAMTYAGNPANLRDVEKNPRYAFIHGDICDRAAVRAVILQGVDVIVNFAAETHVDRSILDSEAFLKTDVLGTHVLLQEAREAKVTRYLQVSTDEVYGDVPCGASRESDLLAPRSPYAASKAGADLQALAFHATHATPVVVTRGSNTYGPYQYPEKLIPLFITNLMEDKSVPLYGDGKQIRDWLHVEDHARGILHVLEYGELGQVYNIGGGNPRTNLELTHHLIADLKRSFHSHVRYVADREGHDRRYALDCARIQSLGWQPRVPFEEGLTATVRWYHENENWWRPLKSGQFAAYYERQYAHR